MRISDLRSAVRSSDLPLRAFVTAARSDTSGTATSHQWPPAAVETVGSVSMTTTLVRRALRARATAASSSRSEEHTSELQSLMRISYAVFCLKKKKNTHKTSNLNNYNQ